MARLAASIRPAEPGDHDLLRRLMQLYCYDFSEFAPIPLNDDGTFGDPEFIEEQFGPGHDTFIIEADGRLAGFAIVTRGSQLRDDSSVIDMTQFFVVRAERHQGIGESAATQLFERYPGKWEIRVLDTNEPAQAFWRATVDRTTTGNFAEEWAHTPRHRGPVITFEV